MKIISWNINGIRAVLKKGFLDFLKTELPDICGIQEIKISETARATEKLDFPGYREYFNSAKRPGYSGTAILIKENLVKEVVSIKSGFGKEEFDLEGRVQILELKNYYLLNIYFPNANHELSRLDYKREFNDYILTNVKKLETKKPVIVMGDFNVAFSEIDLARPKENIGNPGFTFEEREDMGRFLGSGLKDTFREVNGDKIQYSWWSYRAMARVRSVGWRIDYLLVSAKLLKSVEQALILDKVMGSDHCPVGITIKD
ncbi:MAG: exodeoxyribonuclease III [Candidatus Pacebacteria bacterium]|nr:exodeoxyribonuclease III [Candidatus Paceibacterota bacterium]